MKQFKVNPTNSKRSKELFGQELGTINSESTPIDEVSASNDGPMTFKLILFLMFAVIGGSFQFGWNIGVYNTPEGVLKLFIIKVYDKRYSKLIDPNTLTLLWSVLNGLFPLGGIFGGLSCGYIADKFGRRHTMIGTNILIIISGALNIMSKFVDSYETLIASRFIVGFACGIFSGVVPMYLNELPPQKWRGLTGTMNQLMVVVGILVSNVLGLPSLLGTPDLWPVLVGFMLIPALAHIGLFFAIESPKFLFTNRNNAVEARKALLEIRGLHNEALVDSEMKQLETEKIRMSNQNQVSWMDLIKRSSLFYPLLIACGVQISQQLSGINAVIFYSTNIFASVGLKDEWPQYASILLNVVQLFMTILCMFLVDRLGRRILLIIGMVGMCVSSYALAITSIVSKNNPNLDWVNYLTVVAAVFYIIFFAVGPGAIPWLITTEMFGSDSRGKATSIAVFINWTSNFIVTVSFPFIKDAIDNYSFVLFGSLLVLFSLFMIFFVPETKNKTVEELQEGFKNSKIAFRMSKRNSNVIN